MGQSLISTMRMERAFSPYLHWGHPTQGGAALALGWYVAGPLALWENGTLLSSGFFSLYLL